MMNKQAIEALLRIRCIIREDSLEEQALVYAIKVLEGKDTDVPSNDTISRQDAITKLKEHRKIFCKNRLDFTILPDKDKARVDEIDACIAALMNLPPAQQEPQWTPVSERLPKEGERVLATHLGGLNPNRQVIEHVYERGAFCYGWDMDMDVDSPTFGQRYMGKVIAWMPLPEPWEKQEL